jgi:hypothetical protein
VRARIKRADIVKFFDAEYVVKVPRRTIRLICSDVWVMIKSHFVSCVTRLTHGPGVFCG